jgi:hypothetical protein
MTKNVSQLKQPAIITFIKYFILGKKAKRFSGLIDRQWLLIFLANFHFFFLSADDADSRRYNIKVL